jgi:hypothetical protein
MTTLDDKRVVAGCKLPTAGPVTDNERAWVEFLRIIYDCAVPAPSFDQIVLLRRLERRQGRAVERPRN